MGRWSLPNEFLSFIFRNCWKLRPDQFKIENAKFQVIVEDIISKAKKEFNLKETDEVHLEKLLLYSKGAQVQSNVGKVDFHDKEEITLFVQLPSTFQGHTLNIYHNNQTKTVHFDQKDCQNNIIYAAYPSNCTHETLPLESGYRMVLHYKFIQKRSFFSTKPKLLEQVDHTFELTQNIASALSQVYEFDISVKP